MKCEWVLENLVFYVYDELADDARHELEQHVGRCTDCALELAAVKKFRSDVAQFPVAEPSPNLLATSRMRLQEALESAEQGAWWHRFMFVDPVAWLHQVRFAPALAAAIFMLGFAGGIGVTYKMLVPKISGSALSPSGQPSLASISGINSVSQPPGSDQITIQYDTVSSREAHGALTDPQIQQLLLYAARNNFNAGVRMDSVNLLTQQPTNPHVREALLYSLRYDSNTGVRLKALDSLGPYIKDEVQVRDAVLEALMSDSNPGIRIEALRLLEPVRADSAVRIVLERLAAKDENRYIRSRARTLVAQLPEMN